MSWSTRLGCAGATALAMCGLLAAPAVGRADGQARRPAAMVSHAPTQVVAELSDRQAAAHVHRAAESRPDDAADNQQVPSDAQLAYFRSHDNSMPSWYLHRIDGNYRGTTDEIIQWAAYKWGLDPQLLWAVAAVESWWHMSTVGDEGNAFGLFQIDRRYHCCQDLAANDTAWNADYYGAILRSYYDGTQTWLNTVSGNGKRYGADDLWNSVGYWAAGRWDTEAGWSYVGKVQADLDQRVWQQPYFTGR
jgi:Transglycosylase SLT domain